MTTPEARITHPFKEHKCRVGHGQCVDSVLMCDEDGCGRPRSEHAEFKMPEFKTDKAHVPTFRERKRAAKSLARQPAPILPTEPERAEKRIEGMTRQEWRVFFIFGGMPTHKQREAIIDAAFGPAQEEKLCSHGKVAGSPHCSDTKVSK